MDKIKRFRNIQTVSFDDFLNVVVDTGICKCCESYEECLEMMGESNMEAISGNGCSAFDNTVDNIKKIYLVEQCIKTS